MHKNFNYEWHQIYILPRKKIGAVILPFSEAIPWQIAQLLILKAAYNISVRQNFVMWLGLLHGNLFQWPPPVC